MARTDTIWLTSTPMQDSVTWTPVGGWLMPDTNKIDRFLHKLQSPTENVVQFDLSQMTALDTAGAMVLWQLHDRLVESGHTVNFLHVPERMSALLNAVGEAHREPLPKPEHLNPFYARVITLGQATIGVVEDSTAFLSFLGLITLTLWRSTFQPWRLRFTAIVFHMEEVGLKALPLVGLLAFLIGVVISYQGAQQLQQFGADLYVVDLLGISVLREIGVLMTAIIIAGRSGSAFTAQIGTMQVNQEIDALKTLGLSPVELLVLPRVIALTITLPLLALYANVMALLGGAVVCSLQLDIAFVPFLRQLQDAIGFWTLWVGLIKAPVFAFVIAVVGCYQGFRVTGSAESVGQLTTRSVVHSIFLVMLLDGFFSVLFAWLKI